ncbi:IS6 family transposase [Deinococcus sp. QL22]|uniref:IS6 family transposase n=1 Tax=Deinococcus sp. QL22 TaxID=2939437 RepID=UPI002017B4B0|nr:IS6 family transposase [Deinococcus sp. QL22]UQN08412.1 IS6 family transposase [Deinococcus sp. QL22]
MTDAKPYRPRFPMTMSQPAGWLDHRFPLSYRDVQELLHQRGIEVSHETLRESCIKFEPRFAEDLRHRESRRGSRWFLDEVCTTIAGGRHRLWRAVDEHGSVQGIFQRHRDPEAAKTFLTILLGEHGVPEVIHTDGLRNYGVAIWELPSLRDVNYQKVIFTARCNNLIEQEHRPTRRQERSQQGLGRRKRAQSFLSLHACITNLHQHSRRGVSASTGRQHQKHVFQTWSAVAAGVA